MWFMNRIANPFVTWILRSPLHGWMSAAVLLITYRGRKSGRPYTLPVQYVQDGSDLYILPGYAQKKTWWRNLTGGREVQVMLKGRTRSGWGIRLNHKADAETIRRAFGLYLQRFPPSAKIHQVRIDADGRIDPEDLRRAAESIEMIQVRLDEGEST